MAFSSPQSNAELAALLRRQEILTTDTVEQLLTRARTLQEWLGQVAVDDGVLSDLDLALALSSDLNLAVVNLDFIQPDQRALSRLPAETCCDFMVIPAAIEAGMLVLAMANPLDKDVRQTIKSLLNSDYSVRIAPMSAIREAIRRWYGIEVGAGTSTCQQPHVTPASVRSDALPAMDAPDRACGTAAAPAPIPSAPAAPSSAFTTTVPTATPVMSSAVDPSLISVIERPGMAAMGSLLAAETEGVVSLDELLYAMYEGRASDLHLAVGSPPMMRVDGDLKPMGFPKLSSNSAQHMIYAILTDVQITTFERSWELDFAYSLPGVSRFRVNIHRQRGSVGAVLRVIPKEMPTLDKLGMPPVVREMTMRPRGLVLVTGPTGSGKSTTLAAMIDEINRNRRVHIVSIEDPIEFLHANKQSVVTQREVGEDTQSFTNALRHVLRQDPDVILIGEMRDLETTAMAVTAAETGHLVFSTLHTTSASQTIDRIIDVFPPHQQEQIRNQLSNVLEGIVTQTLLPNLNGKGRCCAQEILICTPAVRNLIREGKVHQMASVMQASAKYGMQTLDHGLKQLVLQRKVSFEEALKKTTNPEDFKSLIHAG